MKKVIVVWVNLQKLHRELRRHGTAHLTDIPVANRGKDSDSREELVRIHRIAWRISPWTTCLRRSIVLCQDLRRLGVEAEVVTGACKGPSGTLIMHSWVEDNGTVVGDSKNKIQRFTRLDRQPF